VAIVTRKPAFDRRYKKLSKDDKDEFQKRARWLLEDLDGGRPLRATLRVRKFRRLAAHGVLEFSFGNDCRAFFQYGPDGPNGEKHVIWLNVGDHRMYEHWEP
jgi:hypothetical protein